MSDTRLELSPALESPSHTFEARLLLVAQSGSASFAGKVFLTGARLITAVVLARLLGAQQYGLYNLALVSATLIASFAVLGLDVGLVRFIAIMVSRRDQSGLSAVLRLGILVPLAFSVVAASSLFYAAEPLALNWFGDASLIPLLQVAGLLIPFLVWNNLGEAVLRGFHQLGLAVLINSFLQPALRFVCVWLVVLFWASALGGLTTYLLAVIASSILFLLVVKPYLSFGETRPTAQLARELMGFSLPVYLSDIAGAIGVSAQTFLLGAWGTLSGVGIFAIAGQLAMIGRFFHGSLVMATMPIISEMYDRGAREDLGRLFRATSKWSLTLNLPLFLILWIFPSQLLNFFGASFVEGTLTLQILALSTLVDTGTGIGGALLTMTGHTRLTLFNTIVSTLLSVGLGVLLIPRLGLVGAALAVLGAACAVNALRLIEGYHLLRLLPYDLGFIRPLIAGCAAALVTLWIAQWLPASNLLMLLFFIGLLLSVYALVILVLGLSQEDRIVLTRARAALSARRAPRNSDASIELHKV